MKKLAIIVAFLGSMTLGVCQANSAEVLPGKHKHKHDRDRDYWNNDYRYGQYGNQGYGYGNFWNGVYGNRGYSNRGYWNDDYGNNGYRYGRRDEDYRMGGWNRRGIFSRHDDRRERRHY